MLADLHPCLRGERGQPPYPARRLEDAVGNVTECGSEATRERRLEAVDPLGREARPDEGLVLGAQLVSLLVVDGDPSEPTRRKESPASDSIVSIAFSVHAISSVAWASPTDSAVTSNAAGMPRRAKPPLRPLAPSATPRPS